MFSPPIDNLVIIQRDTKGRVIEYSLDGVQFIVTYSVDGKGIVTGVHGGGHSININRDPVTGLIIDITHT